MLGLTDMIQRFFDWWTLETFRHDVGEMRRSVDEAFTDLRRSCGVISGDNPKA